MDTADQKIENRKAQLQKEERALNEIKDKVYAGFSKERAASMGSPVDSTARRGTRTRQAAMPYWDAKVQDAQLERGRMQEEVSVPTYASVCDGPKNMANFLLLYQAQFLFQCIARFFFVTIS